VAKKSELESGWLRYSTIAQKADALLIDGYYNEAIDVSLQSLEHLDYSTQYQQKFLNRNPPFVDTLSHILEYAPLFFRTDALERLASMTKVIRTLEGRTGLPLAAKLISAPHRMKHAYQFWKAIEDQADAAIVQRDVPNAKTLLAKIWMHSGLVDLHKDNTRTMWKLRTDFIQSVACKCHSCGDTMKVMKAIVLSDMDCLNCTSKTTWLLLAETT
jgi:hypothetical protein